MKQRLMRPTAALFPIVGLAGALAGSEIRDFMLLMFPLYFLIQLASLCAADSFRNAAACEPGVRRVDRRFAGALIPLAVGIAVAMAAVLLFRPSNTDGTDHAALLFAYVKGAAIAASLISIEHLFEERMFALGRRVDGVALSCVSNGLLLAGALLDAGRTEGVGLCLTGAAALGAGISVAANYLIEPAHGLSPLWNLRFSPRACVQTLLYPTASVAAALLPSNGDGTRLDAVIPALLFGLIPWRLARTTARRTPDESRPLNLLLIAFAAIPAVTATWLPAAQPFAQASTLALLCAAAIFCAPGARLYTGTALIIAAVLPVAYPWHLNAILALAAVAINLKGAFLRKV